MNFEINIGDSFWEFLLYKKMKDPRLKKQRINEIIYLTI